MPETRLLPQLLDPNHYAKNRKSEFIVIFGKRIRYVLFPARLHARLLTIIARCVALFGAGTQLCLLEALARWGQTEAHFFGNCTPVCGCKRHNPDQDDGEYEVVVDEEEAADGIPAPDEQAAAADAIPALLDADGMDKDEPLTFTLGDNGTVPNHVKKTYLSRDNVQDMRVAAGMAVVLRNVHLDMPKLCHGYNTCQAESSHNSRLRFVSKRVLQAKMTHFLSLIPTLISHKGELWVYDVLSRLGVTMDMIPPAARAAIDELERVRLKRKERASTLAHKKKRKMAKKIRTARRADELRASKEAAKAAGTDAGSYVGKGKGGRTANLAVATALVEGSVDRVTGGKPVRGPATPRRSKEQLIAEWEKEKGLPESRQTVWHCVECGLYLARGSKAGHFRSKAHITATGTQDAAH